MKYLTLILSLTLLACEKQEVCYYQISYEYSVPTLNGKLIPGINCDDYHNTDSAMVDTSIICDPKLFQNRIHYFDSLNRFHWIDYEYVEL